ncbi:MAG: hypothetical protein R3C32_05305 [Chloroflexota bacterium]
MGARPSHGRRAIDDRHVAPVEPGVREQEQVRELVVQTAPRER